MNFKDDYKLIYREDKYPDCIKFHNMNGVLATVGTLSLAQGVEELLKEDGYTVKLWKPGVT